MKTKGIGILAIAALGVALALPLALISQLSFAEYPEGAEYVGHNQCKVCHNKPTEGAQWNVWSEKYHAKAFELLKTDEAKAVAEELGLAMPAHESPDCLKCHVTGYNHATASAPAKIDLISGVQCETCHGPGSAHLVDGRKLAFGQDASIDVMANLHHITEATCLQCHNDSSPTWKTDRYTTEDGRQVGFDYEQALKKIAHPNPLKAEN